MLDCPPRRSQGFTFLSTGCESVNIKQRCVGNRFISVSLMRQMVVTVVYFLICILLVVNEVENIFVCSLAIYFSELVLTNPDGPSGGTAHSLR